MGAGSVNHLSGEICGTVAITLSLFCLYQGRGDLLIVFASFFLLAICITDTLYSKIPNLFTLLLTLLGFGLHGLLDGPAGLLTAAYGLLTGLVLLLIPYLLGGMGAGDVKALAAMGALLGAEPIFQVFLYVALAGGLMSVLHYIFNRNLLIQCRGLLNRFMTFFYTRDFQVLRADAESERLRFPYAAAIAFGFFARTYWGNLV